MFKVEYGVTASWLSGQRRCHTMALALREARAILRDLGCSAWATVRLDGVVLARMHRGQEGV